MNVKRKVRFVVSNYGAKNRKGVKARWRKPRGIDSHKRVMRKGYGKIPRIGYKNRDGERNLGPDGSTRVLVHDERELREAMQVPGVSVILSHALSQRKKLALQKIAEAGKVKVANGVRR